MKLLLFVLVLTMGVTARAEWYVVTKVLSYNKIQAQLSKGTGSKSGIVIRIKNLERIEYITNDRAKVLLGGSDSKKLLESIVPGQIVWIDQLESINGENVAYLYPSYEQLLKAYMKHRMTGSYTLTPAVKQSLISVHKRMISAMKNGSPNGSETKKAYENEYSKALFVYDGLNWFKKTGQFLPSDVQEIYVDWLGDYLTSNGTSARDYEIKIRDMQKRNDLYRDFLFEE